MIFIAFLAFYSFDFLSADLFTTVNYRTIDWSLPIFDILENYCGMMVITDITKVTATNADGYIRGKLALRPDDALILLDEVGYGKSSRPLLRSLEYYTDFFDFSMLRKKL